MFDFFIKIIIIAKSGDFMVFIFIPDNLPRVFHQRVYSEKEIQGVCVVEGPLKTKASREAKGHQVW